MATQSKKGTGAILQRSPVVGGVTTVRQAPAAPATVRLVPTLSRMNPEQQQRYFTDLENRLAATQSSATTNILGGGNLIQGVPFANQAQVDISHGLGRPWIGYFLTNWDGAPGLPGLIQLGTLGPGQTSSLVIPLLAYFDGTGDIYVF